MKFDYSKKFECWSNPLRFHKKKKNTLNIVEKLFEEKKFGTQPTLENKRKI